MMKKLDNSTIIDINRHCYDTLGADYTDGVEDFEKIQNNGIWQSYLDLITGGGTY